MSSQGTDVISALLSVLTSFGVPQRSCVYISTPISTGTRYVRWHQSFGLQVPKGSVDYDAARRRIKDANLAAARSLTADVRERADGHLVIDPTAMDIDGWEQRDYHLYWMEVISRYVHTVVFADGWQYSEGCAVEFAIAAESGLNLVDHRQWPIQLSSGLAMVVQARDLYQESGLVSPVLADVARRLQAVEARSGALVTVQVGK